MLLIKGGMIHDAINSMSYQADILIESGKIMKVEKDISAEEASEIYNASGMDIYPGFIDVHTHIGMFGYAGTASKDDVEKGDRCTPNHRAVDAVNPQEDTFEKARNAGVTCVCITPGSVGCIGGTAAVLKTYGYRIDDMIVKNPVAMKIAFGENPKSSLNDKLTTRMTIAATIREILFLAREYERKKRQAGDNPDKLPPYSPKLEALIPVVRREIPLKAHAHRSDDIFTAIRIAKECGVDLTIEHASQGGCIAEDLAREGFPVAFGPCFSQSKKSESSAQCAADGIKLIRAGCCVSVMTDSPVIAQDHLPLCAGLLMREGLSEFEALKTITINPAKHLGIEDRVGTISVGKDADLVIAKGCPMQMTVKPEAVFIDGRRVESI